MVLAKIKAWSPIITAILAFIGMIVVAMIQYNSASKSDVDVLIKQINEKTLPYLQSRLDDISDRISRLEGKTESIRESLTMKNSLDFPKKNSIPKLKALK